MDKPDWDLAIPCAPVYSFVKIGETHDLLYDPWSEWSWIVCRQFRWPDGIVTQSSEPESMIGSVVQLTVDQLQRSVDS